MAYKREELTVTSGVVRKTEDDKELEAKTSTATLEKPFELKAIVPARACNEFLKIFDETGASKIRVSVFDGQIVFENETSFLCSRLIGGEYPSYYELFPTEHIYLALFNREEMQTAIERVAVMCDERTNLIKLHFEDKTIQITANTPDVGRAYEEVSVDNFAGKALGVAVNVRYVLDVLQKLSSPVVRLEMNGALQPLIFKGGTEENYKYLLMPVQATS